MTNRGGRMLDLLDTGDAERVHTAFETVLSTSRSSP